MILTGKTWKGFDYIAGKPVEMDIAQWRLKIAAAASTYRLAGDLMLRDSANNLTAEVYDRE